MNNNGIQIGIADDQAKDFDFEKTEMKYDSTGMFHWSSAKSLEECILVSDVVLSVRVESRETKTWSQMRFSVSFTLFQIQSYIVQYAKRILIKCPSHFNVRPSCATHTDGCPTITLVINEKRMGLKGFVFWFN